MPTFDLDAARKAGYSDDEIADGLASQHGVDIAAARQQGYSTADMLPSLMDRAAAPAAAPAAAAPAAEPKGIIDRAIGGIKSLYDGHGAAPIDPSEAAMTNPMGDIAGTVERTARVEKDDPNEVGFVESAARAFPQGSAIMAKTVGLAASAPAVVYDAIKNSMTGGHDTDASDWAFKHFVDPWEERAQHFAIKPEERQTIAGKIGSGIGNMAADLPYMIISGGASAEGAAVQAGMPKATEYLAEAVRKGFDAMRPIMIKSGSEKAEEVLNRGGSVKDAITAGTTAAMLTGFMGSAPMSAEGAFFKRLASGMPIGAVTAEASRQVQNAAMPEGMEAPFSAEGMVVGAATNALAAGAMGHASPGQAPNRAELGYMPKQNAMSSAVRDAYAPGTPIINTARAPQPADIASAKTVDEAIATATASVQNIDPTVLAADNNSAVSNLLQSIRPLDAPKAEPAPAAVAPEVEGIDLTAGSTDHLKDFDPTTGDNVTPGNATSREDTQGLTPENGKPEAQWQADARLKDERLAAQLATANENAARRNAEREAADRAATAPKAADAGTPIDGDWHAFPDNSGTLGIPRADMPQIRAEHRGALTQFLAARGITHEPAVEIASHELKPTQQEFSPAKVDKAEQYQGGDRSILVSSDGHVLDGHHQWMAKMVNGQPVKAIRLNAPIKDLLAHVAEFPSVEASEGAAKATADLPGADILAQQKFAPEHGKVDVVDPATLGAGEPGKMISADGAAAMQALGRALGKDVHFYSQEGATSRIDGFAPQGHPGALFVNAHAGDAGWHYVAGHEFFHQMPKEIQGHFIAAVKPLIKAESFARLQKYINQPHLDHEGIWGEIGADLFGNRFGEKGFFDKLAADMPDRSTATKVFEYIQKFIEKVSDALAGKKFATDEHVTDLEAVRAAARDALDRYLATQPSDGMIGGKRIADMSDADLNRFTKTNGSAGERARAEVERRKQADADMTPVQRREKAVAGLQNMSPKQLRDVAENHQRAYMREAAADILATRAEATSAKRSEAMKRRMRADRGVDEHNDSMATAIAKLGGISRDSASGRMRLAPEELAAKGMVGNLARHLFVKNGVRMDEMGQMLAELGYVDMDEHGKHDQSDFEDKLATVAGGESVYTATGIVNRAEARRAAEMEEIGAKSDAEMAELEHYADLIENWAGDNDVDLSHIETMYPEAKLITEDDAHDHPQEADEGIAGPEDQSAGSARIAPEGAEDAGRSPAFSAARENEGVKEDDLFSGAGRGDTEAQKNEQHDLFSGIAKGAAGKSKSAGAIQREQKIDQRDLFSDLPHGDLFGSIPVRPGTTEAQKQAGRDAVSDLARRLGVNRIGKNTTGARASVLGMRLLKDFSEGKPGRLVGAKIEGPADLAALAQVYRDPRFETFRAVYMKDGAIIGESGYTSRLPAAVNMPPDLLNQMISDMVRFKADGYYLMHNHPSGHAEPSPADRSMTRAIDQRLAGFLGHIIIDHNEYAVIHNWGDEVIKAPELNGKDFTSAPEMEHKLLGLKVDSPSTVAQLAKSLQIPSGHATLVLTTARAQVQLLVDVPMGALRAAREYSAGKVNALIQRMARESGSGGHRFLILPKGEAVDTGFHRMLLRRGSLTDVVADSGDSLLSMGAGRNPDFMSNNKKSIRIAEGEDFLTSYDKNALTEKAARAADKKIADRAAADTERDAFTLTPPKGSVTGESEAMSDKRQQPLFSAEREQKNVQEATGEVQSDHDTGADIPLSFFKKTKVPHDVWVADEGQYETVDLPAHKALSSVREDIDNLKRLLNCLKG